MEILVLYGKIEKLYQLQNVIGKAKWQTKIV